MLRFGHNRKENGNVQDYMEDSTWRLRDKEEAQRREAGVMVTMTVTHDISLEH